MSGTVLRAVKFTRFIISVVYIKTCMGFEKLNMFLSQCTLKICLHLILICFEYLSSYIKMLFYHCTNSATE